MGEKAHGIMYHHFHDKCKHIVEQGSISAEQFDDMLEYYGKAHNIISAEEFLQKSQKGRLKANDVCLTFDDGLLCQYDVAYPVMKNRGLTGFWFIYTSPLDGVLEKLEIYRNFRFSKFSDIEDFYAAFFDMAGKADCKSMDALSGYNPDEHMKECPFYTPNDKRFRYLRDDVLGEEKYKALMDRMIEEYRYDIAENAKILWLNADSIADLHENGNIIGLHSYSHPTVMIRKDYEGQKEEYGTNKSQLEEIIGEEVISVSYPCNSYNADTIQCMRELGISIGFRANMVDVCPGGGLLYPREDHANILREMERKG